MVPHSTSAANHTCKDDTHMHIYTNAHTHTLKQMHVRVCPMLLLWEDHGRTLDSLNTIHWIQAHTDTHKGNDTPEVSQVNYM